MKRNLPKTDINKRRVLDALEKSLGIVTKACKMADISRATFYEWMRDDKKFELSVKETGEVALDFAESKLFEQINDNIPSSTIFYLKTKGRKRGYVERIDVADITEQPLFSFTDNPKIIDIDHEEIEPK